MLCRGVRPDLLGAVAGLPGGGVRLGERPLPAGWCWLPGLAIAPPSPPNFTSCWGLGLRAESVWWTTELGMLNTGRTDFISLWHHGQGGLMVRDCVNSCNEKYYTRRPPHTLTLMHGQQNEWPQLMDTGSVNTSSWQRAQATSASAISKKRSPLKGASSFREGVNLKI